MSTVTRSDPAQRGRTTPDSVSTPISVASGWLVTDLSGIGLHEHLLQQPERYRAWILERPEQVLFGSDRYLGAVPDMRRSWDILEVLDLGDDVGAAVRHGNARRFTPALVPPR